MNNTKTNRDIFNFLLSLSVVQLGTVSDFLKQLEVPVKSPAPKCAKKKVDKPDRFKIGDKAWYKDDINAKKPVIVTKQSESGGSDWYYIRHDGAGNYPAWLTHVNDISPRESRLNSTKKSAKKTAFVKKSAVKKKYPPNVFVHGEKVWWKKECGKKQSVIIDRRDRDSQWYFVRYANVLGVWLAHARDLEAV